MEADKRSLHEKVAKRVDANRDDLVRFTRELVRIPSVNPPGDYEEISQEMAGLYEGEGLHPVVASATKKEVEALGLAHPRPNVIALVEGAERRPGLCLDAHMDVVAPGDASLWRYPPFGGELHEGRIYGRGAEDTKCHLAAALIACRAIREAGVELKADLLLTATVDDEIGAWPGMGYLVEKGFEEHGFRKPDYHIAGEPTGLESVGCLARGRLWYEIVLKGVSAHGGNPAGGVNAIEKALALAAAVKRYPVQSDPLMGSDTINLGTIRGGEAVNVVPGRCKITFDIRPSTDTQAVKEFMERTIRELKEADPDFNVESLRLLNDRRTGGIGPEHDFVKTVQHIAKKVTGKEAVPRGSMAGYSSLGNAYWTSTGGIAGLMYGGGDFQRAHAVDEFISVDELLETTRVFAALALELCA